MLYFIHIKFLYIIMKMALQNEHITLFIVNCINSNCVPNNNNKEFYESVSFSLIECSLDTIFSLSKSYFIRRISASVPLN